MPIRDYQPFDESLNVGAGLPVNLWVAQAAQRLYFAQPLALVQIPGNGQLFGTLTRLPGACPELTSEEGTISTVQSFRSDYGMKKCPMLSSLNGCFEGAGYMDNQSHYPPTHYNFSSFVSKHGVVMLRKPNMRIAAAYHREELIQSSAVSFHQFAAASPLGGQVKLLTRGRTTCAGTPTNLITNVTELQVQDVMGGEESSPELDPAPPTQAEVDLAKERLRTGFPFLGLAEEWELSMCLLHTTFGAPCSAADFASRPDEISASLGSQLEGFSDPYDDALYAEAKMIFEERLRYFGLNEETCLPCFEQAGLLSKEA